MGIPTALRAPLAVMFLVFMGVLGVFSWGFNRADNEVRSAVHDSCVARNDNQTNTNRLLEELIEAANKSVAFDSPEKVERIAGWAALRQPLEECVSP